MRTSLFWMLAFGVWAMAGAASAADGLAMLGRMKDGVAGVSGLNGVLAVVTSPDGRNVYAASARASTLTVFRRDPMSGALRFVERQIDNTAGADGLDHVRDVVVSPDGGHVYAAGEQDDAVAVFARDPGTGALTFIEVDRNGLGGVTGLNGPRCLAVAPDGAQVYVGSAVDDALVVFDRSPDSGTLHLSAVYQNDVAGVTGLRGPEALAFGPDGTRVYVAASDDNSVAVFARNAADGTLTFLDLYRHSTTVPDGLDGVRSLVVAPDGLTVYVAGKLDDAITSLARDPSTNALSLVGQVRDTVDGIDGLDAVEALALSPDGRLLYAVGSNDNAIAVFRRDDATGALTFLHVQRDGTGSLASLVAPKALVLSPDGASIYVAASGSDAIDAFDTRCGDGTVGRGEQCDDGNAVNGDGCSAGCRRECAAATDCEDADRCTEEVCRAGECALPKCGFRGAICEIKQAQPAVRGLAECLPLDRRFGRTIRRHLALARTTVWLVQHPPVVLDKHGKPKKPKKVSMKELSAQVGKVLSGVERKTAKLQQQGFISTDCLAAVTAATEGLRSDVATSLQRKGLCTP